MSDDASYAANKTADRLFVDPTHKKGVGAYVSIARDDETLLGEIDVTDRTRVALSAFWHNEKRNYTTYKITKIKYHKTYGWREDGHITVNYFHLAHIAEFNELLGGLDFSDTESTRIDLAGLGVNTLNAILRTEKGREAIEALSSSPALEHDIFAIAKKRSVVAQFRQLLCEDTQEPDWQRFFEENSWIFGHGLSYFFLDKVGDNFEAITTGADFEKAGKRVDGLARTRAEVSQYVFIEIKKNRTKLLGSEYRSGCWQPSTQLAGAITQVQKSVHDFSHRRFRDQLRGEDGQDLPDVVYSIEPRSYLVIGSNEELRGHSDKIASFELLRRNTRSPEIITFDELYYRAERLVENLSRGDSSGRENANEDEEIPF